MKNLIGITGSTGFIGTHLLEYFKKHNVESVSFQGDLNNEDDIHLFFQNNQIETLIHLAGTFFPPFCNQLNKNTATTERLLQIGLNYGLKKIIYSSTGAVYGEPLHLVTNEDDPLLPNTLYGLTKYFSEKTILFYNQNHNISYIILRFPNVYGNGNLKGVIYNFLNDIKNSNKVTISGNGNQSRNFLHVSDACNALYRCLSYEKNDIFNISFSKKYSINDVVKLFTKKFSFSVEYKNSDNNLKDLLMNVSKAKKELNFEALYSLENYISDL